LDRKLVAKRPKLKWIPMTLGIGRRWHVMGAKLTCMLGSTKGCGHVLFFVEEHTHTMVKQIGRKRYYRSHRKVPEEDFQFIQTLHE
jgi:hypothetical protein